MRRHHARPRQTLVDGAARPGQFAAALPPPARRPRRALLWGALVGLLLVAQSLLVALTLNYESSRAQDEADAMATGYMAADFCAIQPGQTVAVWGAGAVGLFAMKSAWVLGAGRVIAIDRVPHRLQAAREHANAETLNFDEVDVVEALKDATGGRGPDACIEAVGMEADQSGLEGAYDRVKATLKLETGRPYAVREAIRACRKGGIVSIVGVFGGMVDKFPLGIAMNKGLTFRMAQQHGQKYAPELLRLIQDGRMDGSFAATHHYPLDKARDAFEISRKREDGVIRVVFKHD